MNQDGYRQLDVYGPDKFGGHRLQPYRHDSPPIDSMTR